MLCAIWYHLYNLKNVKNTHGGVLLLTKLQALADILNYSIAIRKKLFAFLSDLISSSFGYQCKCIFSHSTFSGIGSTFYSGA